MLGVVVHLYLQTVRTGGYGGDVLIHGEKVSFSTPFDALKAGIGMVHQEFSLIPGFTATENILLNREPKKSNVVSEIFGDRLNTLDYKQMNERSAEAIKKMGVHIDQHMVISDMPVGHKQFTEIARELSKDNLKLLILDEPTAVLTEKEAAALLDSIRSMAARGISVIFITHRLQEILSVCDKVVIMRDGVVVKDTPASETNVSEITRCMVGRSVDLSSAKREIVDHSGAKNILSIRNLWVDMPGETVRNVTLDVKEGEILGIGGLAGQGKLGIPNGVMGLYEAGGTVEFDGKQIPLNSPRKCLDASLAFVSEDRRGVGLLLDETLEWNVAFPAMQIQNKFLKKIGPVTWRDEKAIHDITQKYINELMIKCTSSLQKARELSGGMRQRAAFARTVLTGSDLLLLDEPFSALDGYLKDVLQREMQDFLQDYPGDMILVTHSRDEAYKFCRELSIVHEGRILVTGETKQLFERPGLLEAAKLTGCKNFSRAERLGPHEIYAADWKMKLHTEENVDEDITHVGIRGHWIRPESEPGENCMAVQVDQYIETTFEHQYMIRNKAEENAAGLWWMRPKNSFTEDPDKDLPEYLYFPSEHLMLLK